MTRGLFQLCVQVLILGTCTKKWIPSCSRALEPSALELAQDSSLCLCTQESCLIHEGASKLSYALYISHCSLSSRCWTVSPKLANTHCGVDGTRWKLIEGDCRCTFGCVCTHAYKNSEVIWCDEWICQHVVILIWMFSLARTLFLILFSLI